MGGVVAGKAKGVDGSAAAPLPNEKVDGGSVLGALGEKLKENELEDAEVPAGGAAKAPVAPNEVVVESNDAIGTPGDFVGAGAAAAQNNHTIQQNYAIRC